MGILDADVELVQQRFGERLGAPVRLVERRVAGEGLSDETGLIEIEQPGGQRRTLVVRLYRPGTIARHEVHPQRLHRLLTALHRSAIPVPEPLWYDPSPEPFGTAYTVVAWVPGTAVVPWSPEGRAFLKHAGTGPIGDLFCRMLADIHNLDWRAAGLGFLGDPAPGTGFAAGQVRELRDYLDRVRDEPEPIIVDGLGWLAANLPSTERFGLVHGDYRTGNMLFDGDRISAVLDWEFARIGDPLFDLGWVCCPSNRVGTDLVCMLLPEEDFLIRYEQHSGLVVDRAALRFWVVFHQVRHAIMWLEAGRSFQLGATDDLRLARMHYTMPTMRRMVADLLEYAA